MFLNYATSRNLGRLNLTLTPYQLVVRIGASNAPSRTLFERLGFIVSKEVPVFEEVEMRWHWSAEGKQLALSEEDVRSLWGTGGNLIEYP